MNRLFREKSAYLKNAAYQKIEWYPWSDEAFEKAKKEDKPVFLSAGAIWCHWCHVMAKECFENEEIVKLMNENFINIKLDRDERPDIDRRFQQAVNAMGSGGGWPLSVFLTPDKKPFFGGTYFPPEDMHGRPGFIKVLKQTAEFYRTKKGDISEFAERLLEFLKPKQMQQEEINKTFVDDAVQTILSEVDSLNGGFGKSPKFPIPGAIEFLTGRFFFTGSEVIAHTVNKTLRSMADGGFHDQLGGGFHRYSTDEAWIIPHFEKMTDDNAWLLKNYISAYLLFGDEYYKKVSESSIRFINSVLSDNEGGFYASQDADVTPDDEGGYFTWSEEDFKKALDDNEYNILSLHLLDEKGSMHHDRSKKVLFIAMQTAEIARKIGFDIKTVNQIINSGKEKLLKERNKRKSPYIDKTLYTSLNGMMITAYLYAFRALRENSLKRSAIRSLDRIINLSFINNELYHSEGVKAMLDDYIFIAEALIVAYETTGNKSYLARADEFMELCILKFWDKDEGGFFDSEEDVLGIKLKGIEDIPHPSANSVGIMLLIKLYFMTGKKTYFQYSEKALKVFSLKAKGMGVYSGYYYCSLDAYFNMMKITMQTTPDSKLTETALSFFIPYMSLVYAEDRGCVIPCIKDTCHEPIKGSDKLKEFLKKYRADYHD